ncbi:MAG: hypothetical protein O2890_12480 [Cyanobacteria bacterium]|nr:hypothetical protein [Cyanobacteriota bacterium]MDA0867206.1 hypothetical protein [Cyanobacteriota bacterium]
MIIQFCPTAEAQTNYKQFNEIAINASHIETVTQFDDHILIATTSGQAITLYTKNFEDELYGKLIRLLSGNLDDDQLEENEFRFL